MQSSKTQNVASLSNAEAKNMVPAWSQDPKIFPLDWFSLSGSNIIQKTKEYLSELSKCRNCSKIKTLSKLKAVLKRIMMFVFTHISYFDGKSQLVCDLEDDLIAMLALYIDMELRVLMIKTSDAAKGTDSSNIIEPTKGQNVQQITDRICYWMYTLLKDHEQRADALLSVTSFNRITRPILEPIFRKLLTEMPDGPFTSVNYARHVLVYKTWRERVLTNHEVTNTEICENVEKRLMATDCNLLPVQIRRCLGSGTTTKHHFRPYSINLSSGSSYFVRHCRRLTFTSSETLSSIPLLDDDLFSDETNEVNKLMKMIEERKKKKEIANVYIDLTEINKNTTDSPKVLDIIDLTIDDDEGKDRKVVLPAIPSANLSSSLSSSKQCYCSRKRLNKSVISCKCFLRDSCHCSWRKDPRCLRCNSEKRNPSVKLEHQVNDESSNVIPEFYSSVTSENSPLYDSEGCVQSNRLNGIKSSVQFKTVDILDKRKSSTDDDPLPISVTESLSQTSTCDISTAEKFEIDQLFSICDTARNTIQTTETISENTTVATAQTVTCDNIKNTTCNVSDSAQVPEIIKNNSSETYHIELEISTPNQETQVEESNCDTIEERIQTNQRRIEDIIISDVVSISTEETTLNTPEHDNSVLKSSDNDSTLNSNEVTITGQDIEEEIISSPIQEHEEISSQDNADRSSFILSSEFDSVNEIEVEETVLSETPNNDKIIKYSLVEPDTYFIGREEIINDSSFSFESEVKTDDEIIHDSSIIVENEETINDYTTDNDETVVEGELFNDLSNEATNSEIISEKMNQLKSLEKETSKTSETTQKESENSISMEENSVSSQIPAEDDENKTIVLFEVEETFVEEEESHESSDQITESVIKENINDEIEFENETEIKPQNDSNKSTENVVKNNEIVNESEKIQQIDTNSLPSKEKINGAIIIEKTKVHLSNVKSVSEEIIEQPENIAIISMIEETKVLEKVDLSNAKTVAEEIIEQSENIANISMIEEIEVLEKVDNNAKTVSEEIVEQSENTAIISKFEETEVLKKVDSSNVKKVSEEIIKQPENMAIISMSEETEVLEKVDLSNIKTVSEEIIEQPENILITSVFEETEVLEKVDLTNAKTVSEEIIDQPKNIAEKEISNNKTEIISNDSPEVNVEKNKKHNLMTVETVNDNHVINATTSLMHGEELIIYDSDYKVEDNKIQKSDESTTLNESNEIIDNELPSVVLEEKNKNLLSIENQIVLNNENQNDVITEDLNDSNNELETDKKLPEENSELNTENTDNVLIQEELTIDNTSEIVVQEVNNKETVDYIEEHEIPVKINEEDFTDVSETAEIVHEQTDTKLEENHVVSDEKLSSKIEITTNEVNNLISESKTEIIIETDETQMDLLVEKESKITEIIIETDETQMDLLVEKEEIVNDTIVEEIVSEKTENNESFKEIIEVTVSECENLETENCSINSTVTENNYNNEEVICCTSEIVESHVTDNSCSITNNEKENVTLVSNILDSTNEINENDSKQKTKEEKEDVPLSISNQMNPVVRIEVCQEIENKHTENKQKESEEHSEVTKKETEEETLLVTSVNNCINSETKNETETSEEKLATKENNMKKGRRGRKPKPRSRSTINKKLEESKEVLCESKNVQEQTAKKKEDNEERVETNATTDEDKLKRRRKQNLKTTVKEENSSTAVQKKNEPKKSKNEVSSMQQHEDNEERVENNITTDEDKLKRRRKQNLKTTVKEENSPIADQKKNEPKKSKNEVIATQQNTTEEILDETTINGKKKLPRRKSFPVNYCETENNVLEFIIEDSSSESIKPKGRQRNKSHSLEESATKISNNVTNKTPDVVQTEVKPKRPRGRPPSKLTNKLKFFSENFNLESSATEETIFDMPEEDIPLIMRKRKSSKSSDTASPIKKKPKQKSPRIIQSPEIKAESFVKLKTNKMIKTYVNLKKSKTLAEKETKVVKELTSPKEPVKNNFIEPIVVKEVEEKKTEVKLVPGQLPRAEQIKIKKYREIPEVTEPIIAKPEQNSVSLIESPINNINNVSITETFNNVNNKSFELNKVIEHSMENKAVIVEPFLNRKEEVQEMPTDLSMHNSHLSLVPKKKFSKKAAEMFYNEMNKVEKLKNIEINNSLNLSNKETPIVHSCENNLIANTSFCQHSIADNLKPPVGENEEISVEKKTKFTKGKLKLNENEQMEGLDLCNKNKRKLDRDETDMKQKRAFSDVYMSVAKIRNYLEATSKTYDKQAFVKNSFNNTSGSNYDNVINYDMYSWPKGHYKNSILNVENLNSNFAENSHQLNGKIKVYKTPQYEKQYDADLDQDDVSNSDLIIDTSAESSDVEEPTQSVENEIQKFKPKYHHRIDEIVNLSQPVHNFNPINQPYGLNSNPIITQIPMPCEIPNMVPNLFNNIAYSEEVEIPMPNNEETVIEQKVDDLSLKREIIECFADSITEYYEEGVIDYLNIDKIIYETTKIEQIMQPLRASETLIDFYLESCMIDQNPVVAKNAEVKICIKEAEKSNQAVISGVQMISEECQSFDCKSIEFCYAIECIEPERSSALAFMHKIHTNDNTLKGLNILAEIAVNSVYLNTKTENNNVIEISSHRTTEHKASIPLANHERCMIISFDDNLPIYATKPIEKVTVINHKKETVITNMQKIGSFTPKGQILENKIQALAGLARNQSKVNGENLEDLYSSLENICEIEINKISKTKNVESEITAKDSSISIDIPNTALLNLLPDDDDDFILNQSAKTTPGFPSELKNVEPQPSTSKNAPDFDSGVEKNLYNVIDSITNQKFAKDSTEKKENMLRKGKSIPTTYKKTRSATRKAEENTSKYLFNIYKSKQSEAEKQQSIRNNSSSYIRTTRLRKMVTIKKPGSVNTEPSTEEPANKSSEEMFDKLMEEHKKEMMQSQLNSKNNQECNLSLPILNNDHVSDAECKRNNVHQNKKELPEVILKQTPTKDINIQPVETSIKNQKELENSIRHQSETGSRNEAVDINFAHGKRKGLDTLVKKLIIKAEKTLNTHQIIKETEELQLIDNLETSVREKESTDAPIINSVAKETVNQVIEEQKLQSVENLDKNPADTATKVINCNQQIEKGIEELQPLKNAKQSIDSLVDNLVAKAANIINFNEQMEKISRGSVNKDEIATDNFVDKLVVNESKIINFNQEKQKLQFTDKLKENSNDSVDRLGKQGIELITSNQIILEQEVKTNLEKDSTDVFVDKLVSKTTEILNSNQSVEDGNGAENIKIIDNCDRINVVQDWLNKSEMKVSEDSYSEVSNYQTGEDCSYFEEVSNSCENSPNVAKSDDKVFGEYQTPDSGIVFDEDSGQKDKSLEARTPLRENISDSETYYQPETTNETQYCSDTNDPGPKEIEISEVSPEDSPTGKLQLKGEKENSAKKRKEHSSGSEGKKRKAVQDTLEVANTEEVFVKKRKTSVNEVESVMSPVSSHKETPCNYLRTKGSMKEYSDCLFGISESPVASGSFHSDISLTEEPKFYEEGGIDLCNDRPVYDSFEVFEEQVSLAQIVTEIDDTPKDVQLQQGYSVPETNFLPLVDYMNDGDYILLDSLMFNDKRMVAVNMHQVQPVTKPHNSEETKKSEFDDSEKEDSLSETVEEIIKNPSLFSEQPGSEIQLINMDQESCEAEVIITSNPCTEIQPSPDNYMYGIPDQIDQNLLTNSIIAISSENPIETNECNVIEEQIHFQPTTTVLISQDSQFFNTGVEALVDQHLTPSHYPHIPQPDIIQKEEIVFETPQVSEVVEENVFDKLKNSNVSEVIVEEDPFDKLKKAEISEVIVEENTFDKLKKSQVPEIIVEENTFDKLKKSQVPEIIVEENTFDKLKNSQVSNANKKEDAFDKLKKSKVLELKVSEDAFDKLKKSKVTVDDTFDRLKKSASFEHNPINKEKKSREISVNTKVDGKTSSDLHSHHLKKVEERKQSDPRFIHTKKMKIIEPVTSLPSSSTQANIVFSPKPISNYLPVSNSVEPHHRSSDGKKYPVKYVPGTKINDFSCKDRRSYDARQTNRKCYPDVRKYVPKPYDSSASNLLDQKAHNQKLSDAFDRLKQEKSYRTVPIDNRSKAPDKRDPNWNRKSDRFAPYPDKPNPLHGESRRPSQSAYTESTPKPYYGMPSDPTYRTFNYKVPSEKQLDFKPPTRAETSDDNKKSTKNLWENETLVNLINTANTLSNRKYN